MLTVAGLGEVGLIRRISRRMRRAPSVVVGIGDDAAVLRISPRQSSRCVRPSESWLLFASDMLVEGVHFRRGQVPASWIGWKALACNVSDIAAMGGLPTHAVVSLGLPATTPVRFVDGLYRGLRRCAARFGVAIVGGDTVRAPCVVIDVAIVGRVRASRVVLRSGAHVGDRLFVTGRLGGSLASGRHARLIPRLREAQALLRCASIHAMMDLSDGLASDCWQMARASRVTLRIVEADVPVAAAAKTAWHALMDGEDFELLFAVSARDAARLPTRIEGVPLTEIGEVVAKQAGVELVRLDGRVEPLRAAGFKHF